MFRIWLWLAIAGVLVSDKPSTAVLFACCSVFLCDAIKDYIKTHNKKD